MTSHPYDRVVPFWQGQSDNWADRQVQAAHHDALYGMGEYAMFVLMWHERDFRAGLVARCPVCYQDNRAAQAFRQAEKRRCPACYGTTFEGGFRARIVRPAIITDRRQDTVDAAPRGTMVTDTVAVETTEDFTFRSGDYVFRADGTRYQGEEKDQLVIRSGLAFPEQPSSVSGFIPSARLETDNGVAYTIPPTSAELRAALDTVPVGEHEVPDFSHLEEVRGPLVLTW